MQVVILCGGRGTRISDVSDGVVPKPMVQVGDRPILWHIMKHYSTYGHDDFILCLGYLGWKIKEYFISYEAMARDMTVTLGENPAVETHGPGHAENWKVTLAETGLHTMTAGRVRNIGKYVTGEHFMLTYGDGLSNVDIDAVLQFHLDHGRMLTLTGVQPPGRFGELHTDGSLVTQMNEKPVVTDRHINGGFMVCRREFIDHFLADIGDDVMLEDEPFERAAEAGEMMMFRHDDFWQCMDTRRDWEQLNRLWQQDQAPWKVWR